MIFGEDTEPAAPVRDLSKDIILQGKIRAVQVAAAAITGETPQIINRGEYIEIVFTENQKMILRDWIKKSLTAAPGTVRIDYYGLTVPPLVQVYGKIAVVILIAAFFLGRLTK